jgi:ankyrin repeat protein
VEILLNRGADPNKADLEGRTPLFDAAGSPVEGHEKTEAMIENRARLDAKDNSGQIALHAAAANGIEDVVNMFLRLEPSLITTQDVEGKYPYQSAIAGAAGHHSLSRELLAKLEEFQADGKFKETMEDIAESTEKINTVTTEVQETMAAASDDDWRLLNPGQVEHTEKMSNYRLTHVFNFSARTYMQITHNLETKTDVVVTKSFDEFADKSLFEAAYGELKRLGGKADESVIHGPVIAKDKAKAPSL